MFAQRRGRNEMKMLVFSTRGCLFFDFHSHYTARDMAVDSVRVDFHTVSALVLYTQGIR